MYVSYALTAEKRVRSVCHLFSEKIDG